MKFEKIDVTKANVNPFQRIGQDWMLISAKKYNDSFLGNDGRFLGKKCSDSWYSSTAFYKGICGCRRYLYTDIF